MKKIYSTLLSSLKSYTSFFLVISLIPTLLSSCLEYVPIEMALPQSNHPPRIIVKDPTNERLTIKKGETLQFNVRVADPNIKDTLYVYWFLDADKFPESSTRCPHSPIRANENTIELSIERNEQDQEERELDLECQIRSGQVGLEPGEFHVLKFVVGDRPALTPIPQNDGNIKWSEGGLSSQRLFIIQVDEN